MDIKHYNQKPVRDAQFIMPPNMIKAKVGSGGLQESILDRAEKLLESNTVDFAPLSELYLNNMKKGIEAAKEALLLKEPITEEAQISAILYPCVQLKANGGMFHYPLVTRAADRFVQFMEVVERIDHESLEIAQAFHTAIRVIVAGKIKGDGGTQGNALIEELNNACMRYFEKHKNTINFDKG